MSSLLEPVTHTFPGQGLERAWATPYGGEGPCHGLHGRLYEREVLDQLVAGVLRGQDQVLILRGEAGIGKTTLLEYLRGHASGCRIASATSVKAEMELAYAALHQLCAPFLGELERLPDPQRATLSAAFGLREGDAPDRFLIGLAALSLLSAVAADRPLLCVIDNAQWLDSASAQALAFVARHLVPSPIGLVFAERTGGRGLNIAGSAELTVAGLADDDARSLLDSAVPWPLDARVRDRIVAETGGNPQALLEAAHPEAPETLAGGFALPDASAKPGLAEEDFQRRLFTLPPDTRRLLLLAAALPTGDSALVWRAADQLGIAAVAAEPAVAAGLIRSWWQMQFCHPLARIAAYRMASPTERRGAHRALAEAADAATDSDRRAWQRAHAIAEPDEDVAADLERAAEAVRARGGLPAAAAFRERAAELSPEPARRARRAFTAARAKHQAGATDSAIYLLEMAQAGPLDECGRAQAELLRAQLTADPGPDRDALRLLIKAGRSLEKLDAVLAREAYRDAFRAVVHSGRLGVDGGMLEVAEAVRTAALAPQPGVADPLLRGMAGLAQEDYAAAVPVLRRAVTMARETQDLDRESDGFQWLRFACWMSREIWDDESWQALSVRLIRLAREAGALKVLPAALLEGTANRLLAGEFEAATSLAGQAERVVNVTGSSMAPYGRLMLSAWAGRETETAQLVASAADIMDAHGEGRWLTAAAWATAVLHNGLGHYEEALAAAEKGSQCPYDLGLAHLSGVELIEAAARGGRPDQASGALERLSKVTTASGTDWGLGLQARSRALLSGGAAAERCFCESIRRLGRTGMRADLARAHLLYGEWLRRERRRGDARKHLRTAWEMLDAMGINGFAERARRELMATGDNAVKRSAAVARNGDALTPQEARIARLALEGLSNPEIGVRLFISTRTVQYHLSKVFAKLGITSRTQLHRALSGVQGSWPSPVPSDRCPIPLTLR